MIEPETMTDKPFTIDGGDQYRIHRVGARNIAIQKFRGNRWRTISYHGNSIKSLATAFLELVVAHHTPGGNDLAAQLETLSANVDFHVARLTAALGEKNTPRG
jgi:hypothetical protein